jgi:hypothetical protein
MRVLVALLRFSRQRMHREKDLRALKATGCCPYNLSGHTKKLTRHTSHFSKTFPLLIVPKMFNWSQLLRPLNIMKVCVGNKTSRCRESVWRTGGPLWYSACLNYSTVDYVCVCVHTHTQTYIHTSMSLENFPFKTRISLLKRKFL